jgi:uncharacterized membrane protein YphA (DoxX/SURF4 family)
MTHGPRLRFAVLAPWLGLAGRLILAGVFAAAGAGKVTDLAASGRAVNAYQLMPFDLANVVGAALPFMELALALFLLAGLATRAIAAITAGLLLVYIGGIASAWARGLSIDCGCFSTGGALAAGAHPAYLWDIVRDLGLLAVAGLVVRWPRTRFGLDGVLLGEPPTHRPEEV